MSEPATLDYYDPAGLSVVFYDFISRLDPTTHGDADYFAQFAPPGATALELGCGTGRVLLDLAARGVHVTGVDLSSPMLYRAHLRLSGLGAEIGQRVSLVLGDMTAIDLQKRFDLVFVAFFGLAHLPPTMWEAAFRTMALHMGPESTAIVHLPDPALMVLPPEGLPEAPVLKAIYNGEGDTLEVHLLRQDFDGARFEQVLAYVIRNAGGAEVRRSNERLAYYVADPAPAAEAAGLAPLGPSEPLGAGRATRFRLA